VPKLIAARRAGHPAGLGDNGGMTNRVATATATALLIASALTLSGCAPSPWPGAAGPSSSPSADSSPSASPSPSEEPTAPVPDFSATCDEVLGPDAVYDFNPNLGLDVDFAPASGSMAARVAAAGGVDCGWQNLSSGSYLVAAVAEPGDTRLSELEAEIADVSRATTVYGETGFFAVAGGMGEAVVFVDGGVIVVSSDEFTTAEDAAAVMKAAITARTS